MKIFIIILVATTIAVLVGTIVGPWIRQGVENYAADKAWEERQELQAIATIQVESTSEARVEQKTARIRRDINEWLENCSNIGIRNDISSDCEEKVAPLAMDIASRPILKEEMDSLMVLCAVKIIDQGQGNAGFDVRLACTEEDTLLLRTRLGKEIDSFLESCKTTGKCGHLSDDVERYVDRLRTLCNLRNGSSSTSSFMYTKSEHCQKTDYGRLIRLGNYSLVDPRPPR